MSGLRLAAVIALPLLGAAPGAATAATKIEGEYQIQLDIRKQDRFFPWDYDYNNDDSFGLAQFRILSQPREGVEAFLKFEEDWNRGNNSAYRPEFQFREAHVRYRWEKAGHGIDTHFFSRQDRFWVDNHLIEVVRGDNVKDSDNGQGFRIDGWGWAVDNVTYIYSDFSGQSNPGTTSDPAQPADTDDAHIFRARREFPGIGLRTGVTYNRKVEGETRLGERGHTEVYAGDVRYNWHNIDFQLEYAESHLKHIERADSILVPGHDPYFPKDGQFSSPQGAAGLLRPNEWLPSDATVKAEIRSISVGSPTLGYFNLAPYLWYAGPDYSNPLGDSLNDERGYWVNSWYLVPQRAITVTANYGRWRKDIFEQKRLAELYVEIYTEYVNGFTSKFFHRRRRTRDYSDPAGVEITENNDLFAEVQVESRLAWMRIQGKIKDLDTEDQKELASLETSVNLTSTLKMYNRFTFGNDPARVRESLFAELQYRPRQSMQMFLSYGPWWIGDSPNPVDDGDLEGGAQNKDIVKFVLQGFF
jgi:hypothetical protein